MPIRVKDMLEQFMKLHKQGLDDCEIHSIGQESIQISIPFGKDQPRKERRIGFDVRSD